MSKVVTEQTSFDKLKFPPMLVLLIHTRKPTGATAHAATLCYHQQRSYQKHPAIKVNL